MQLMFHNPDGNWLLMVFLGESVDWGNAVGVQADRSCSETNIEKFEKTLKMVK